MGWAYIRITQTSLITHKRTFCISRFTPHSCQPLRKTFFFAQTTDETHQRSLPQQIFSYFPTSIPLLLRGLVGESEADPFALHPQLTHPQREHCLRGKETIEKIVTNRLHILTCSFFISLSVNLGTHLANF
jgi:hypothetical protein